MSVRISMATVLCLLATACPASSGTVVRVQVFGDADEIASYGALIEAFGDEVPDTRIELTAVPSQGDHVAKLATAFSAGTPPDLFLINYRRFGQFAARNVLEPLEDRLGGALDTGAFFPQPLDAFRFDGRLLCLPQNVSSLVVYWNTALFDRFGVEPPRADWTWDEFLATAKQLTKDTDGDGETDVYGVGTEPSLIRLMPFVWQAGGELVDDVRAPTRTTLIGPRAVRGMRFFIELRRVHRVAPSQEEAASEGYEERFARGGLGMLLESRRVTAALRSVPDLSWDVAPLPRDREAATILHSDAYCMARSSQVKEAAFRFVEFALGPVGAAVLARTGRTVPSIRSVATSDAFLDPTQEPASAQVFLDNLAIMRRTPNIAAWNEIETKADVRVEEWYYGTELPQQLGIEIDLDTRALFAEGA